MGDLSHLSDCDGECSDCPGADLGCTNHACDSRIFYLPINTEVGCSKPHGHSGMHWAEIPCGSVSWPKVPVMS